MSCFIGGDVSGNVSVLHVFSTLGSIHGLRATVGTTGGCNNRIRTTVSCAANPIFSRTCCYRCTGRLRSTNTSSVYVGSVTNLLAPCNACSLIGTLGRAIGVPVRLRSRCASNLTSVIRLGNVRTNISIVSATVDPLTVNASRPTARSVITTLRNARCSANLSLGTLARVHSFFAPLHRGCVGRNLLGPGVLNISTGALLCRIPNKVLSGLLGRLGRTNGRSGLSRILTRIPHIHGSDNCPPLIAPASRVINARSIFGIVLNRHCGVVAGRFGSVITNGCNGAPYSVSPRFEGGVYNSRRVVSYHPTSLLGPRLSGFHSRVGRCCRRRRSILSCTRFNSITVGFFRGEESGRCKLSNGRSSVIGGIRPIWCYLRFGVSMVPGCHVDTLVLGFYTYTISFINL